MKNKISILLILQLILAIYVVYFSLEIPALSYMVLSNISVLFIYLYLFLLFILNILFLRAKFIIYLLDGIENLYVLKLKIVKILIYIFSFFCFISLVLKVSNSYYNNFLYSYYDNFSYISLLIFTILCVLFVLLFLYLQKIILNFHNYLIVPCFLITIFIIIHFYLDFSSFYMNIPNEGLVYLVLINLFLLIARFIKDIFASYEYTVKKIDDLDDSILFELSSKSRKISHKPGQFVYLTFKGLGLTYPYTIASSANGKNLRFYIKSSPYYLKKLKNYIYKGAKVKVEGAFGNCTFNDSIKEQVWIAENSGITPFVASLDNIRDSKLKIKINLVYIVDCLKSIPFKNEIESLSKNNKNVIVKYYSKKDILNEEMNSLNYFKPLIGKDRIFWFCGSSNLKAKVFNFLEINGQSSKSFRFETFTMSYFADFQTYFSTVKSNINKIFKR